ncbi:MAG TPA: hypothetical protein VGF46_04690 [Gaiellales bacterium]|jgi:hypothetical protein
MAEPEYNEETYALIAEQLLSEPDIDEGRLFSATGLRTHGKIFTMISHGRVVVKLPAGRCSELARSGGGEPFQPGGKKMREWLVLTETSRDDSIALAGEALAFVRSLR